jgi:tetratricopeptide (TPR) repeat protein
VRAQIATGQFAEAEFNLSRLVQGEEGEKRRDLQHLRVRCLVEVDRLLEAREGAIKLTQGSAGQADVEAWIELGNISYMLNDLTRARQCASRVISIAPDRVEGYVIHALQLRRGANFKEALTYLEKANSVKPQAQTFMLMAMTYKDMRRTTEMKRCLEEALKLDPTDRAAEQMLSQVTAQ